MKKTLLLFLVLCCAVSAPCLSLAEAQAQTEAYSPVLDMYIAGLSGDEAVQELDEFNISCLLCPMYDEAPDPLQTIGCAFLDLDGDAVPELLIGGTEALGERFLFDVWTLENDAPVLALRGWERNRMYLRSDESGITFYNEGSNSAFESIFRLGRLVEGSMEWTYTLLCITDEETVWTLNDAPVGEDEANRLLQQWQEGVFDPELTPLAALLQLS